MLYTNRTGYVQNASPISAITREPKLSDRVAEQLEGLVVGTHFKAGERLPSERELAARFGVSRTVIREAVRSLVAKGLLEVRTGSGTVVRTLTSEPAAESMSLLLRLRSGELDYTKLIEVRRMLEVEIAGLAAQRRTPADIKDLEDILQRAEEHFDDPDVFVETDVAFHLALARATHNELFSVLLDSITAIMVEVRRLALRVPGAPARALVYHPSILERVRAGDVEGARAAMHRHMDEASETMKQVMVFRRQEPDK